ncbi:MAG: DUF2079 domain-containing protein [Polyangiales bacterium]
MSVQPSVSARDRALAELWLAALEIFVAGASFGLCLWELAQGDNLAAFATRNERGGVAFGLALPSMVLGAAALGLVAVLGGQRAPDRLAFARWLAKRCSPVMLAALIPPLGFELIWDDHPLPFLVLASLLALGTRLLVGRSLSSGPAPVPVPHAPHAARLSLTLGRFAPHAPVALVITAATAYAIYFGLLSVQNHHNLETNSFDLGIFDNIFWNTAHRWDINLPASPYGGPDARHLGQHATLIVFVLAPIYALAPRAETTLWIQAVGVGLAALPLYLFASRHLRPWIACLVAIAYLFYPPVHGPNLYDFHFLLLAPLIHWTSLCLLEARRDRWAALFLLLGLLVREDAAAGVAIIGAYLIATKQRPRAGLLLCVIGSVYMLTMKLVVMPGGFGQGGSFVELYQALVPQGGKGLTAVLKTLVANPVFALGTLLTYDKLIYALQIAAPLAFLPWIRPLGLLCSLPGLFFCLLVTNALPLIQISFQYTPHWTTYLFLALVANLEGLNVDTRETFGPARQRAALAALVVGMALCSHQFGAILQHHTARAGYRSFVFGTTAAQQADYRDLRALIAKMPSDARVVGSERVVPHVSNRRYAYTLRYGIYDAQYILAPVTGLFSEEHQALQRQLRGGHFGVVEVRGNFFLAKRGYSTAQNRALLPRLR